MDMECTQMGPEALFEAHKSLGVIVARRMWRGGFRVAGYDRDDMEQEATIAVWDATQKYDPTKGIKFSSFATMCAEHMLLRLHYVGKMQKRKANAGADSTDRLETVVARIADSAPLPDEICCARLAISAVYDRLDDDNRRVIDLFSSGKTSTEISHEFGITRQAVEQKIKRFGRELQSGVLRRGYTKAGKHTDADPDRAACAI